MTRKSSQAQARTRASRPFGSGRDALAQGAWEEARTAFEAELERGESPEALEGLGAALCWLGDLAGSTAAREQAFRLYQERSDRPAAARVATSLAVEFGQHRSEFAVADGWFQRARRLLADIEPGPELVWLSFWEASTILHFRGDAKRGGILAAEAAALSRKLGIADAAVLGAGLEGLRLVGEGRFGEGMKLIDEAATAAVTGELADFEANGNACCYVLTTCERVRDYERANQWLERVVARHSVSHLRRLLIYCSGHHAGVLTWRGEWARADAELDAVIHAPDAPPSAVIDALLRQAEVRRLRGLWDDAAERLQRAEGHTGVNLGWAALALDQGDYGLAIDFAHRYFRSTADDELLRRAAGEVILAHACAAGGNAEAAAESVTRLRRIAEATGTDAMRAELRAAEGAAAAAAGSLDDARRCFEDAVDLFARSRNPYETARSRLWLAEVLHSMGRAPAAQAEAHAARDALRALGAAAAADRANRFLDRIAPQETRGSTSSVGGLSPRQMDVLRLLALGLSNREIGKRLSVSEYTIKRHVADILTKLDLPTRAAAAAYAVANDATQRPAAKPSTPRRVT